MGKINGLSNRKKRKQRRLLSANRVFRDQKRHEEKIKRFLEHDCEHCGHVPENDETLCDCECHHIAEPPKPGVRDMIEALSKTAHHEQRVIFCARKFLLAYEDSFKPYQEHNVDKTWREQQYDRLDETRNALRDAVLMLDVHREESGESLPSLADVLPADADPDEPQPY